MKIMVIFKKKKTIIFIIIPACDINVFYYRLQTLDDQNHEILQVMNLIIDFLLFLPMLMVAKTYRFYYYYYYYYYYVVVCDDFLMMMNDMCIWCISHICPF